MCSFAVVFFFKQKTAYEMRISDWSSDVCSSDLRIQPEIDAGIVRITRRALPVLHRDATVIEGARHFQNRDVGYARAGIQGHRHPVVRAVRAGRSEEHTSELQSLMRISYAVFCLKKKKTKKIK